MLFFKKAIPNTLYCQTRLQQLPVITVDPSGYTILERPALFHSRMLELIKNARTRIMMTVLYLQDDEAGREILSALYEAMKQRPQLYVRIYVDFHRAQRGLIGKGPQTGNSALYYKWAEHSPHPPAIYGVPVKKREVFGVMHLKGCVFDNTVLYSGASINNVYLQYGERYRLDRYHEIISKELADCLCAYTNEAFHINYAVQDFSQGHIKPAREIKDEIKQLRTYLTTAEYSFKGRTRVRDGEIGITPLVGLGKRVNPLNRAIIWILGGARKNLFICTPYFNPPKVVLQALEDALKRGVNVTLVAGSKIANDFYIAPDENFSAIVAIPYIYEQNLRAFVGRYQELIDSRQLKVMLWEDGSNTYHLKGIYADGQLALITGNNLNPRAWALDLENGLIVHDPHHLLQEKYMHEQQFILAHTRAIKNVDDLESFENYPEQVKKVLERVRRFRASIIIKQLL